MSAVGKLFWHASGRLVMHREGHATSATVCYRVRGRDLACMEMATRWLRFVRTEQVGLMKFGYWIFGFGQKA